MTDAHIPAPVVSVSNLIKQFGRFAALRGVTAEFFGGKLYAILGDNGAGKTTLLRTLAGLCTAQQWPGHRFRSRPIS